MIIKSSTALRNDYNTLSNIAHETGEPVYIKKNGDGDIVIMSIDAFKERETLLNHRASVLEAEFSRLNGEQTYSMDEVRNHLRTKYTQRDYL